MDLNQKDFEDLSQSPVWLLMQVQVLKYIEDCRDLLERGGPFEEHRNEDDLRGSIRAFREIMDLPHIMANFVRERNEDSQFGFEEIKTFLMEN